MTHFLSKRLPRSRPGAGLVLAAVTSLVAALGLGAVGQAKAAGSIAVEPFGSDIVVGSDKTLIGVGDTGEIVHGELHLDPGTHNVILRNTTSRTDEHGTAFDPRALYAYHLDPAAAVPALVEHFSGPQARIGH
ncbi:hypothetical protein ACFW7O_05130 [Streptomyces diastatochromogenes]|uniref:hypothetical protein n=1 Tax=Streptomyces diastatochromogenes TaxID=42236 RepID=UPI0036B6BDA1